MPEITVLIYTARDDYPYVGKAEEWHCFEPFLRTLADQTFRDFELVLVDALWETRPDWFRDHPQPFSVKHVPSKPNYWQERGRVGLCAQINRGFVWADGQYVWMGAETNLYPPHHLALVAELCRSGKVPSAWYGSANHNCFPEGKGIPSPCPDISFDMCGFTREDLCTVDHRSKRFIDDPALVISPCHQQHYYGYSAVPLNVAIAVNGFDELMDGVMALQDCDFSGRIVRAGCSLVMHRDLYVVEPTTKPESGKEVGYPGGIRGGVPFQCNYAILQYNQLAGRRVNTRLPPGYAEDVQTRVCRGICPVQEKCRGGTLGAESLMYPFCAGEHEAMARERHTAAPNRDLNAERESRKSRKPPYDKGFIQ